VTFLPDDTQPTRPLPHRSSRWAVKTGLIVFSIFVICLSGLVLISRLFDVPLPRQSITLVINDQAQTFDTSAQTVNEALAEQHITLTPGDALDPLSNATLVPQGETTIRLIRARPIHITHGTDTRDVWTTLVNPSDILKQASIALASNDRLWLDGQSVSAAEFALWLKPVQSITIRPAMSVTIVDGTDESSLSTAVDTVGEALYEAGVTLFAADTVTPDLSAPLAENTRITITRAQPITILADGQTIDALYSGQAVGEALAEAGLTLTGLDYSLPSEESAVTPGMTIQVVRVTEDIITEDESLPFETLYQADAARELDTQAVIQAGQEGIRRHTVRIHYENGEEISREYLGSEEVTPLQNKIIAYGTQIVLRTIDTPEGPREYWRTFKVYATSYHPSALGGDNRTAIGMTLAKGVIGADPKLIPWRTNLYVPEYGLGVMGDTGGARRSRYWIDLGYTDDDYVSWHRYTEIYLLTPVPENIPYLLPPWSAP
jgi:resuscitation-promoting factor RpfB